jgi:hypothetical protein
MIQPTNRQTGIIAISVIPPFCSYFDQEREIEEVLYSLYRVLRVHQHLQQIHGFHCSSVLGLNGTVDCGDTMLTMATLDLEKCDFGHSR